jgi:hypothetical protein
MRRLEDLGILVPGARLPDVQIIEGQARAIGFPGELLDEQNGPQDGREQLSQG